MTDRETAQEMTPEMKERIRRADTVYGVLISVAIGFVVSILANIYFELFVIHAISWSQLDHLQVFGLLFALVAFGGFLEFFIEDYRNELKVNRGLIARFARFFFYDYTPGKFIRWGAGAYLTFVLVGFVISAYIVVSQRIGYPLGTVFLLAAAGLVAWRARG